MRARLVLLALWGGLLACDSVDGKWVEVRRGDLVLDMEVTGTLESEDMDMLGPPPIAEKWDYKIVYMAPEGEKVKKGDRVVAFDATELRQELQRKQNESESTKTELEKRQADEMMARRNEELAIVEAEAQVRKARLKVDRPDDLVNALELSQAELDLKLAEEALAYQKKRVVAAKRLASHEIAFLRDRFKRAQGRVATIRSQMMQMMVMAPRAGTVVYVTDWEGQKKKVGDSVWRAQKVLKIVSLEKMKAIGDIDEVDVSRIAVDQRVVFRLDAHPDVEFTGTIRSIVKSLRQQSRHQPLKVMRVEIGLDEVDTEKMRPGMRYRGTVETERVEDVLLVPVEALFAKPTGPVAYRQDGGDYRRVSVRLGRRNQQEVEILEGLEQGDWVSRRDLEVKQ